MSEPVEIEFLLKNRTKSGMAEVESGLDSVQQDASKTQAVIATLREEMQRLQQQVAAMPTLDQSNNIAMIEALQAKIGELESDLSRISKTAKSASASTKNTTLVPKDAAKAQSTFNGLNMSIQQIAREMPSLAMGPQMFFLAISNNLPIFADNVQRAREEYDMLVKSGQKGVPVWKQILKSLFSWQTALTTGIMLLVMYGKEIGNWVSELVGGKSALDEMRESMAQTYELEKKAQETAARTRFELMSVIASIKEFNGTKDAERQKIDELNSKYGETFGYYQTLSEWYDTLSAKAEQYTQLLFLQAKQQSLVDKALEADDKVNKIQNTPWQDYNTWWGYGGRIDRFFSDNERYKNSPNGQWLKEEALAEARAERDDYLRQAEELRKEAQGIVDSTGLTDVVEGSVQDLENTIAAKRKALKDLTNKADYDAALAEIKVYEDKLEAITGGKKKTGKTGDSDKSKAQSLEKLSDMELAARQRVEEQVVELMKDGYDKQRAEAELNFRKEKQRIEKEEQERLALYDKLKASGAKVSSADRTTITAQAAAQRVQAAQLLDNRLAEIDRKEEEENRKKLEKLLGQYQDYAAQREAIERKYNEDISALRSQLGGGSDEQINRAIQVAEVSKQKDLSRVDAAEASEAFKDNDFLKRLFGDYSSMSFKALQDLIAQARQLREYLSGNGSAEGITFISPEDLANIEKSPADLDKLRKALDKLLKAGSGSSSNKWEGIFKTFEKGLAKLKGAKDFNDISDAIGSISGAASSAAGELSDMFEAMGDTQTADAIGGVQQVLGAVSNIGQGFAKGGIIGGIGAAIGEAANFIGQAFAAEARHQEALKEIERAKLDFQRQYNLALLEQNLLFEKATSVFGERQVEKAINAIDVFRQAYAQLKQEMAGSAAKGAEYAAMAGSNIDRFFYQGRLSDAAEAYRQGLGGLWDAQIVTGHKKTGLFGWGKGKDLYSSILEVYPELIDANGELDTTMLQTILDTRKMSDETRAYLENLIELKDAMDEAEEALEDYLQQTFGSLGDGILDSITTALAEGGSALENFADEAASVLENLGEQIAYSLFFADKFDELESQLKDVYGGEGSPEDIANEAMEVIGNFYDGIGSDMSAAQAWLEAWREKAEEMGFDLWQGGTSQSGKAGAFTTMTQDQGTKLEGLFTSGQIHWASIDEKMDNAVSGLGGCLDVLGRIATNTSALPLMLALLQSFQRDGLKMK
ncbi:hypothetical protein [Alistipes shahii]|uniref:hypothetical protein n=1 Tax=Alistipes putredinis TaxID=28117 RepID=UPI002664E9B6|nr:hypothetical protein [Alistipes shahii]